MIWVLDSAGQPQPRRVRLGITNGRETALLGDLKEGDTVITGELGDEDTAAQQRNNTGSPFGGGRTPLRVVLAVAGGGEEDVRHVSGLCLIQQRRDTGTGEPKYLTRDLASRYPQGL